MSSILSPIFWWLKWHKAKFLWDHIGACRAKLRTLIKKNKNKIKNSLNPFEDIADTYTLAIENSRYLEFRGSQLVNEALLVVIFSMSSLSRSLVP